MELFNIKSIIIRKKKSPIEDLSFMNEKLSENDN